jgi:methylated-DNA-[protein]-cysteine S-methyltransferase
MTAATHASGRAHTVVDSPVGPLTLVATDGVLTGLYLSAQRHRPATETFGALDATLFTEVTRQLDGYFAGTRTEFDVPITLVGTAFQRRVWTALREIPYGHTITYGHLGDRIGQPTASRAVGLANGRNPISIVVPCHRVVGAAGALTGYGGGLDRKQQLLAFEGANRRLTPGPGPSGGGLGTSGRGFGPSGGGFGNRDPHDDVQDELRPRQQKREQEQQPDDVDVPAVLLRQPGAHSGDDLAVTGTYEGAHLPTVRVADP